MDLETESSSEALSESEAEEELELSLDFDMDESGEAPEGKEDAAEELELSDLDLDLDMDLETESSSEALSESEAEEEPELSLDFDMDESGEAPEGKEDAAEELELSDLDLDLDMGLEPESSSEALSESEAEEELELSLDFDMDESGEAPEGKEDAAEELELSLDFEIEGETPSAEIKDETSNTVELLSGLELDLKSEGDTAAKPAAESEDDLELSLDFEFDSFESEPVQTEKTAEPLELESESAGDLADSGSAENIELEFDIEEALQVDETAASEASIESNVRESEMQPESEGKADDDQHSEFDLGEIEAAFERETREFKGREEIQETSDAFDEDEVPEEERLISEAVKTVRKKRVSTPVLVLLIVVLLGALGYGAVAMLAQKGIQLPFISDLSKPSVPDAGNLHISTVDISSKFLDNSKAGKLFVITGNALNEYPAPRGLIKITGKLYSGGKVMAKSQTVFCGNILSELDLANLEPDAVNKRLKKRLGENQSNARVNPGQKIPFMLVFSNLPKNLEEFSVEVQESVPYNE